MHVTDTNSLLELADQINVSGTATLIIW